MPSFTRKAIIESFLKLLNQRPLSQITVKDIVEDCGINRNSFYYHFSDQPSLVEEILKEEADQIIREHGKVSSLEDCLCLAIDFALKNKKAVLHIYSSASHGNYEQYLERVCQYAVAEYINTVAEGIPVKPQDKEIIIKYYKCELIGYITDWLDDKMQYDIHDQVKRLCELFEGSTKTAFERSAGVAIE